MDRDSARYGTIKAIWEAYGAYVRARRTDLGRPLLYIAKAVDTLFGKMDALTSAITTDMGDIRSALAAMRASSGLPWRDMLSVIRDGAVLFSLVVGGILYLANATISRGNADLETRLTRMEVIIGLATANAKRGGTSMLWTPDAWR